MPEAQAKSSYVGRVARLVMAVVLIFLGIIASQSPELLQLIQQVVPQEVLETLPGFENTSSEQVERPADTDSPVPATGDFRRLNFAYGSGATRDFWGVYFTAPTGERNRALWTGGIDQGLAQAIDTVQATLDIAAFEMNNTVITQAILAAKARGVQVRIVTDDEHGLEDDDTTLVEMELAGIPIVDDQRTALMHDKFMILDGQVVWTGSTNYTMNGVYRNNNNMIWLRVPGVVRAYQSEFEEMFVDRQFGPRSPRGNSAVLTQGTTPIEVYFASEDDVTGRIETLIDSAQRRIYFMAFSFTQDDLGEAVLRRARQGVDVEGVVETTGSQTIYSETSRLFCNGVDVRQDGNPGIMHDKIFIIDDTVITGSFNFSDNATSSNDENVVIITEPDIANLYIEEFQRIRAIATIPDIAKMNC